jgi:NAD(P)-dependent dehydrogenase (short-subunit alcohol dehydrogenase family)
MAENGLFGLEGKVAAIIGAGSGIGEAVAVGAARAGATVACLDSNEAAAKATAAKIGANASALKLDIRDAGAVRTALEGLASSHRALDIVVCTPSINVRKPILKYAEDELDRVLQVNIKGTFNVVQVAGRIMTAQGRGSIVLFSSIRSQVVEPGQSVYAMTKAAILQLARTAAVEFGAAGVRVNAVGPGVVETPLTEPIRADSGWYDAYARRNALGRWARAEEMVGPTLFLASDAASYVTGTILLADGGWTAIDGRFTPPGM